MGASERTVGLRAAQNAGRLAGLIPGFHRVEQLDLVRTRAARAMADAGIEEIASLAACRRCCRQHCLEIIVGGYGARARIALAVPQQQLAAAAEERPQVRILRLVPLRELAAPHLLHIRERHSGEIDRTIAEDQWPEPA